MTDKNRKKNMLVICGPTASGKTGVSVKLAEKLDGEIISADSRQVYRKMDIGTGKDIEEYDRPSGKIPCHMIDIVEPYEFYTLFHYQRDCYKIIKDLFSKGKLPIMAGGSGLYIEAVLKKYRIPNVPEDKILRNSFSKISKKELENKLKDQNFTLYTKTDLSSKKRIIRALEITSSSSEKTPVYDYPDIQPLVIFINPEKVKLSEHIDSRLRKRFQQGMIREVKHLLRIGVKKERIELFGMEYKHIIRYIFGQVDYNQMFENLKRDIIRLSKKQKTYFRGMEKRGIHMIQINKPDEKKIMDTVSKFEFRLHSPNTD